MTPASLLHPMVADNGMTKVHLQAWALVRDMGSRLTFWQGQGRNVAKDLVRKLSTDSPILGTGMQSVPCLTVVMLVTGTRGDVQVRAPASSHQLSLSL